MSQKLRVLCLDIEGGFGGSSRSLYESLRFIDRDAVEVDVWCRRDGPVRPRYEALGITCWVSPGMPRMNTLERASRNLYGYAMCARDLLRWRDCDRLKQAMSEEFDLLHFNHEGLLPLARAMRSVHAKPQTMHVRTMIPNNLFGRWQARRMAADVDRLAFITENERANVEQLAGQAVQGAVIYNIASALPATTEPHPGIPKDTRLKIAILSNYSYARGIDRVVEIAERVATRERGNVLFVVAGDMHLRGTLPGQLGSLARSGGQLSNYAVARGVSDMFCFLGHVPDPERVLAGCDLVLKPTRENNPWGRDILEGLRAGKPVISIGRYNRFVDSGRTGFLLPLYDAGAIADILTRVNADRSMLRRLGDNAKNRVGTLCDGPARAADLLTLWRDAVTARTP